MEKTTDPVSEDATKFLRLIEGHRRLLVAIGEL
jgi:hypothetical protein